MDRDTKMLLLLGLAALAVTGVGVYVATRGFRNNNPGNLRNFGIPYVGFIGEDADGYSIFDTLENGIRAMGKDLLAKIGRGLNTVEKIITVYAPAADNNPTEGYIAKVSEWTGFKPNQVLTPNEMPALAAAMIRFENGTAAPLDAFNEGMRRAFA